MEKIISLDDYERKDTFLMFHNRDNPFLFLTVKLDITNIVNYCKGNKPHYATISYIICKTVNEVDNFKYRFVDGKIVYYDNINIGYTQKTNNDIGFFQTENIDDYNKYIKEYKRIEKEYFDGINNIDGGHDQIWVSCAPWMDFTGLIVPYDKNITIPQFIWGKFFNERKRVYTHLMIMAHHGFVDGQHIGDFVSRLENNIKGFNVEGDE